MKPTIAVAFALLWCGAPPQAQERDAALIQSVRLLPMGTLDAAAPSPNVTLERYLAINGRVAVPAIEWVVSDCGEGRNPRDAATCVEGRAPTAPDTTIAISVRVAGASAQAGTPSLHRLSVTQGSVTTVADSLRQFFTLAVRTAPLREPSPLPDGVTEIMVERTWCFGSCPIDTLELKENGTAIYTGKQNTARTGHFTATLPMRAYNELAQWLLAQSFFELRGSYGSPNVDTPTEVMRVTRAGEEKWVVNNAIDRSIAVLAMASAVRAVADHLEWQPVKSGIRGVAAWKPLNEDWRPLVREVFLVYAADDEQPYSVRTDAEGKFQIALLPGTYRIETPTSRRALTGASQAARLTPTIVVGAEELVDVVYQSNRETGALGFVNDAAGD